MLGGGRDMGCQAPVRGAMVGVARDCDTVAQSAIEIIPEEFCNIPHFALLSAGIGLSGDELKATVQSNAHKSALLPKVETHAHVPGNEPRTFEELQKRDDSAEWIKAMEYEIKQLTDQKVFTLKEAPKGANILEPRWVHRYKLKADGLLDKRCSRLVV